MAETNVKVSFYKGKLENYDGTPGAIYFADEGVIMLDDQEYVRYNPSDEVKDKTIETTIGGIAEGTSVAELQGKSFSELFDTILFPVVGPTVGQQNSITWNMENKTVELGSNVIKPSTIAYNQGKWINGDNTESVYTGSPTSITYTYVINNNTYKSPTNSINTPDLNNVTVYNVLASNTYKVDVAYGEGEVPKDSKGNYLPEKQQHASTISSSRTVNVSVPYYTSVTNNNTEKKGALIEGVHKATTTVNITVPEGSSTYRQWFSIPGTIVKVEQENLISGKYEDVTHVFNNDRGWKAIAEERNFNGVDVDYNKYIWYGGARDAVKLKVTFNRSK